MAQHSFGAGSLPMLKKNAKVLDHGNPKSVIIDRILHIGDSPLFALSSYPKRT